MWLIGLAAAWAAADCEPLDMAVVEDGLAQVDQAFAAQQFRRASALLQLVHHRLPCLVEPAEPEAMARYAARRAVLSSLEQDAPWLVRWARAAAWTDPDHGWPDYVADDHPVRQLLLDPSRAGPVARPDVGLVAPEGGAVVLSGMLLARPEAPAETPLLRQVFDHEGRLVDAGWQDGGAFPPELLVPGGGALSTPRWWGSPPPPPADGVAPRSTWLALTVLGGLGQASQRVDEPGTFLADGTRAGPLVGLATHGVVMPGPVGVGWAAHVAPGDGTHWIGGRAGLTLAAGPVAVGMGGGVSATQVVEDGRARVLWLPLPQLSVITRVPRGLEVQAAGGWTPAGHQLAGHVAVLGASEVTWTVGLDVDWLRSRLAQPDSGRTVSVDLVRGGLGVGVVVLPATR